jgi:hypothetical protein
VTHISYLEIFSHFATEELRLYDYMKTGAVPYAGP